MNYWLVVYKRQLPCPSVDPKIFEQIQIVLDTPKLSWTKIKDNYSLLDFALPASVSVASSIHVTWVPVFYLILNVRNLCYLPPALTWETKKLENKCIVCTVCTAYVHCVHILVVKIMSEVYFKYMKQYGS